MVSFAGHALVTRVGVVIWTMGEWSKRVTSLTCLVVGASYCLGLSSLALILYKYSHDSGCTQKGRAEALAFYDSD